MKAKNRHHGNVADEFDFKAAKAKALAALMVSASESKLPITEETLGDAAELLGELIKGMDGLFDELRSQHIKALGQEAA